MAYLQEILIMIKVLFVCHGNICRSTMAEYMLKDMVRRAGREDEFIIDSAATSTEEIGNGVHYVTREKLKREGIPCGDHRARQMTRKDYQVFDHLLGMDSANIRNMIRIAGGDPQQKICRVLDHTEHPRDIADPWYTGNFDETYEDLREGLEAFLEKVHNA